MEKQERRRVYCQTCQRDTVTKEGTIYICKNCNYDRRRYRRRERV